MMTFSLTYDANVLDVDVLRAFVRGTAEETVAALVDRALVARPATSIDLAVAGLAGLGAPRFALDPDPAALSRQNLVRIVQPVMVEDATALVRAARLARQSFWHDAVEWQPATIGEALYELLIASNPTPETPDDYGIELDKWWGSPEVPAPVVYIEGID